MIEIIPAIIAKDFQELQKKIRQIGAYVDWVQLDVMDGQFVENHTWNSPADLKNLETNLKIEAHLMIQNPEGYIDDWIKSGVKRIIIHHESTKQSAEIIKKIKEAGLEAGIAINPETPINVLESYVGDETSRIDMVLIMTVQPGKSGQKFIEKTLGKIKELREKYKNVNIEVDGGINLKTIPKVVQAGANILACGGAVFVNNINNKVRS